MKTMTVNTVPVPKGRPRFFNGHAVTPPKTKEYEELLRRSWPHGRMSGELSVSMEFVMPIPKSLSRKQRSALMGKEHTKKPDLDNLIKAVLDALNGVAYEDDSKICRIIAGKIYGLDPAVPVTIMGGE